MEIETLCRDAKAAMSNLWADPAVRVEMHNRIDALEYMAESWRVHCEAGRGSAPTVPNWYQEIVNLSAGWDEDGSLGPKEPYTWETVGRLALDYAKAALDGELTPISQVAPD